MSEISKGNMQQILDLGKSQAEKDSAWMQNVIVMASGFLGLLIALHDKPSKDSTEHCLYAIILCVIGLGILTGVVYLYAETNTYMRLRKNFHKSLLTDADQPVGTPTVVKPYKIFFVAKLISVVCFFSSVPLLIMYAIMVDSPI